MVLGLVDQAPYIYLPVLFFDMDRKTSPDRLSPDHYNDKNSYSPEPIDQDSDNMATMVAHGHAPNMPGPVGGINKRYRPAPAKTFQCRGYGECRMVFSRSEHLARHIRSVFASSHLIANFHTVTPSGNTLASALSLVTAASSSRALTICASMLRLCTPTSRIRTSV